ncbi:integral membrane sensor signal transduction histidine kinase [Streptomyces noursei]|nr:integral membrane sensor signal transduction histidine kinase [Streptomyces noursei]
MGKFWRFSFTPVASFRFPSGETRRRRWRPSAVDAAVALAAAAYGIGDSLVLPASGLLTGKPHWAAVAAGSTGALVLWRHRFPRSVTGAVLASHVLCYAPGAVVVMLYTVGGMYRSWLRLLTLGLVALAAQTAASELGGTGLDLIHGVPFVATPLLMGLYVATRHQLIATMRQQAVTHERHEALLEERARGEERTRIARELHDVVAHRVSHVVLIAGALQMSADGGADWVRQEAERIRRAGTQALTELRDILGVLTGNESEATAPLQPTPTAADLDALVADCRHLGMDITLRLHGAVDTLPSATQVAIYRVVQEALTNALKHAPGATVTADVRDHHDAVQIVIANGPPTASPGDGLPSAGFGLVGLAERLRVLGGTFETTTQANGAFRVHATIPHRACPPDPGRNAHPQEPSRDQSDDRR